MQIEASEPSLRRPRPACSHAARRLAGGLLCPLSLLIAACGGGDPATQGPDATSVNYKVTGNFSATDFPTCFAAIADISDHFEFVIVGTLSATSTTYQARNIVNAATSVSNERTNPIETGTCTPSGAFELQDVTAVQFAESATTLAVTVSGTTTAKTCTLTPPFGPPTTVPGGSLPTAFVFQFNPSLIGTAPVALPPVSLPGSNGVWKIALVSQ